MIRSTMRTMLRRRLQDVSADQWDDNSVLNDLLNEGLHVMQTEVIAVVPDAFMYIATAPLAANVEFYPLPDGFWYELAVGLKLKAGDAVYKTIERGQYDRDRTSTLLNPGACPKYDIRGRFITFMPIPSFSVDPGYQLQYTPTLDMAVDNLPPDIHTGLHLGVVLAAQLIAIGETIAGTDAAAVTLKSITDRIPLFYQRGGEPPVLRLDAGQPLQPSSSIGVRGSGVYTRNG